MPDESELFAPTGDYLRPMARSVICTLENVKR